jgi:hypothetical protein
MPGIAIMTHVTDISDTCIRPPWAPLLKGAQFGGEVMSDAAPPRLVYIIRHAKPGDANGANGIDIEGNPDPHSLVPRGWQRSGAIGVLFGGGAGALVTPDRLICPDYGATTTAHRRCQTLLGLAGLTQRTIESPVPEGPKARWRQR